MIYPGDPRGRMGRSRLLPRATRMKKSSIGKIRSLECLKRQNRENQLLAKKNTFTVRKQSNIIYDDKN